MMSEYLIPIKWGVFFFPFIAALFTIPYILLQYRKYGSIPFLRVLIVYSFILYLMCAYFLIILPLPSFEFVESLTTPRAQLHPFSFVSDFLSHTALVISDSSTYGDVLFEPWFYQVAFNVLLFIPLGLYLRYYFKCGFFKTVCISLCISLFFELTQLSGLYGIYPRGYRLFDVDDLMINTLGGIVGFLVAGIVLKILPNRDRLDEYAYKKGERVLGFRRIVNYLLDILLFFIFVLAVSIILPDSYDVYGLGMIIAFVLYYVFIPVLTGGQTLGKKFLRLKLVCLDDSKPKIYHYLFRYFLLFFVAMLLPFYLFAGLSLLSHFVHEDLLTSLYFVLLVGLFIFAFIYYLLVFIGLFKGKNLWYERFSHTKNVSVILKDNDALDVHNIDESSHNNNT